MTLSEVNTIKSLIVNRSEFDKQYDAIKNESKNPFVMNSITQFYEMIEVTYLDLERLISKSNLSLQQKYLIMKLMAGWDLQDLSEAMKCEFEKLDDVLNVICEKIKKQNDFEWTDWLETSGSVKVDGEYKMCRKCQKWLKSNKENFSPKTDSKDGFHPYCRQCR